MNLAEFLCFLRLNCISRVVAVASVPQVGLCSLHGLYLHQGEQIQPRKFIVRFGVLFCCAVGSHFCEGMSCIVLCLHSDEYMFKNPRIHLCSYILSKSGAFFQRGGSNVRAGESDDAGQGAEHHLYQAGRPAGDQQPTWRVGGAVVSYIVECG